MDLEDFIGEEDENRGTDRATWGGSTFKGGNIKTDPWYQNEDSDEEIDIHTIDS